MLAVVCPADGFATFGPMFGGPTFTLGRTEALAVGLLWAAIPDVFACVVVVWSAHEDLPKLIGAHIRPPAIRMQVTEGQAFRSKPIRRFMQVSVLATSLLLEDGRATYRHLRVARERTGYRRGARRSKDLGLI